MTKYEIGKSYEMKQFTFFWRTGRREVLMGIDPANAANNAGYGGGAMRALDFWSEGDNQNYEWRDGDWHSKESK